MPAGIYLFKVSNIAARAMFKICSMLTIKTLDRNVGQRWVKVN